MTGVQASLVAANTPLPTRESIEFSPTLRGHPVPTNPLGANPGSEIQACLGLVNSGYSAMLVLFVELFVGSEPLLPAGACLLDQA